METRVVSRDYQTVNVRFLVAVASCPRALNKLACGVGNFDCTGMTKIPSFFGVSFFCFVSLVSSLPHVFLFCSGEIGSARRMWQLPFLHHHHEDGHREGS